jgi:hypothetical protein
VLPLTGLAILIVELAEIQIARAAITAIKASLDHGLRIILSYSIHKNTSQRLARLVIILPF